MPSLTCLLPPPTALCLLRAHCLVYRKNPNRWNTLTVDKQKQSAKLHLKEKTRGIASLTLGKSPT